MAMGIIHLFGSKFFCKLHRKHRNLLWKSDNTGFSYMLLGLCHFNSDLRESTLIELSVKTPFACKQQARQCFPIGPARDNHLGQSGRPYRCVGFDYDVSVCTFISPASHLYSTATSPLRAQNTLSTSHISKCEPHASSNNPSQHIEDDARLGIVATLFRNSNIRHQRKFNIKLSFNAPINLDLGFSLAFPVPKPLTLSVSTSHSRKVKCSSQDPPLKCLSR
jgi:hypothetical protein